MIHSLVLGLVALASSVTASAYIESSAYADGDLGEAPYQTFYSSERTPPEWNFALPINSSSLSPGYIFSAIRGTTAHEQAPVIWDQNGELVWSGYEYGATLSFHRVTYKSASHLMIWVGDISSIGLGSGRVVLVDSGYEVVANFTVDLDDGTLADFHEAQITSNDTALIAAYQIQAYNLSEYGGPENGYIYNSVAQELDIDTGKAIWTWNSIDHVDPEACYVDMGSTGSSVDSPWDYFHINSIDKDSSGNFLIDSRHCCAVYYVDGTTGDIIWSMGGMNSNFTMGEGTDFCYQHDARWIGEEQTSISLFDNASNGNDDTAEYSRGMLLALNFSDWTVSLTREYLPYELQLSVSQGNMQLQDNGNALLGWGRKPWLSEYDSDGNILWAAQFGTSDGNVQAYRHLRNAWTGRPTTTTPSIALNSSSSILYTSWNGATEIATWNIVGSDSTASNTAYTSLYNATRTGFETNVTVTASMSGYDYLAVRAVTSEGEVLGMSPWVDRDGQVIVVAADNSAVDVQSSVLCWGFLVMVTVGGLFVC